MRLPFISRRKAETALAEKDAEIAALKRRIFVLRDNMKQAKSRVRFNIRLTENAAAYCLLDQALIRDMENDLGR